MNLIPNFGQESSASNFLKLSINFARLPDAAISKIQTLMQALKIKAKTGSASSRSLFVWKIFRSKMFFVKPFH